MIYTENVTPIGLAARLAEYIADPSTIRAHVKTHFGRAPSLDLCRNLRRKVEERRLPSNTPTDSKFIIHCQRHSGPYELDHDGYDRCVQCKSERRKAQQVKADKAAQIEKQLTALRQRVERQKAIAKQAKQNELATVSKALDNIGKPLVFSDLLAAVAAAFEMTPDDILGQVRGRVYVDARTALAQILKQRGSSYPMIGKRLNRDHSSIINLLKGYEFRIDRNPLIALVVDRLA